MINQIKLFDFQLFDLWLKKFKMCFGVWFVWFKCCLWVFWGVSTDPERFAGTQREIKWDKIMSKFSTPEDKMKFCLFCFSTFRTLIQTKRNFWKLQLCKVTRPFCWHQEICDVPTQAIKHSLNVDQWRVRMFRWTDKDPPPLPHNTHT